MKAQWISRPLLCCEYVHERTTSQLEVLADGRLQGLQRPGDGPGRCVNLMWKSICVANVRLVRRVIQAHFVSLDGCVPS